MSIKVLPPMEHTFSIEEKGSETGQPYAGTFTYKRPSLRVRTEINKTAAILDGGVVTLDEETKYLHTVFARLKHTLSNVPDWWEKSDYGFELYDLNVVLAIYKATKEFDKEWEQKVLGIEDKSDKKSKK